MKKKIIEKEILDRIDRFRCAYCHKIYSLNDAVIVEPYQLCYECYDGLKEIEESNTEVKKRIEKELEKEKEGRRIGLRCHNCGGLSSKSFGEFSEDKKKYQCNRCGSFDTDVVDIIY
jgi:hypothetical protein